MLALHPPVEAPIVRAFDYAGSPFAPGHHRGIDFGARPGSRVTAPCSGRVTHAGPTPGGTALTFSCAGRRVTLLGLDDLAVTPGAWMPAGAPVATVAHAGGHAGLHLGVRRPGDRLAYLDPESFLSDHAPRFGVGPAPGGRVGVPSPPRSAASRSPLSWPRRAESPLPLSSPRRGESPSPSSPPPAPWPAWLGGALVLLGAGGTARLRLLPGRPARRRRRVQTVDSGAGEA